MHPRDPALLAIRPDVYMYDEQISKIANKKDRVKEKQYVYTKSCNNGNKKACRYIAHLYGSKKRTKLNNLLALALYEDTCTKGHDATSCRYAGDYYLSSLDGITPDIPKGISYLEQSCKPKTVYKEAPGHSSTSIDYDIKGCLDLARFYLYAPQEKYRNPEKAKSILKQACAMSEYYHTSKLGCGLGVKKCCDNLKK